MAPDHRMPFDLARLILAIISILGLVLLSLRILSPFFMAMIWALMIVVACWPVMLMLQRVLVGRRALAVTAMTVMMLMVFILPIALAASTIVENADTLRQWGRMVADFKLPPPPGWVATLPLVGGRVAESWNTFREAGPESVVQRAAPYAVNAAQLVAAQAGSLGMLVVHVLLTVLIAAVMFAQGEKGAHMALVLARRVGGASGEDAVRLAASAIRGVALAVVGTALVQTTLAGLGMALAGVPFAGLLTAASLILCIAQLGPGLILIPAVIWLYWSGEAGWGTFLLLWSAVAITIDNVVRPVLVRFGADLPLLLIVAGVTGGLLSMGLVGLFVGPVVLAVTWRLFEAWAVEETPAPSATVGEASAVSVRPGPDAASNARHGDRTVAEKS
jgi:predicted PurR-regulated permease PerM